MKENIVNLRRSIQTALVVGMIGLGVQSAKAQEIDIDHSVQSADAIETLYATFDDNPTDIDGCDALKVHGVSEDGATTHELGPTNVSPSRGSWNAKSKRMVIPSSNWMNQLVSAQMGASPSDWDYHVIPGENIDQSGFDLPFDAEAIHVSSYAILTGLSESFPSEFDNACNGENKLGILSLPEHGDKDGELGILASVDMGSNLPIRENPVGKDSNKINVLSVTKEGDHWRSCGTELVLQQFEIDRSSGPIEAWNLSASGPEIHVGEFEATHDGQPLGNIDGYVHMTTDLDGNEIISTGRDSIYKVNPVTGVVEEIHIPGAEQIVGVDVSSTGQLAIREPNRITMFNLETGTVVSQSETMSVPLNGSASFENSIEWIEDGSGAAPDHVIAAVNHGPHEHGVFEQTGSTVTHKFDMEGCSREANLPNGITRMGNESYEVPTIEPTATSTPTVTALPTMTSSATPTPDRRGELTPTPRTSEPTATNPTITPTAESAFEIYAPVVTNSY